MFRILFSLAVAAAAYFGPWFAESVVGTRTGLSEIVRAGDMYAGATVSCLMDGRFTWAGSCAPQGGIEGQLVTAAVLLGAFSAAINFVGLLPFLGRITSLFAVATGLVGVAAAITVAAGVASAGGMTLADLRWGAFATAGFGILAAIVGVRGLRGDGDD